MLWAFVRKHSDLIIQPWVVLALLTPTAWSCCLPYFNILFHSVVFAFLPLRVNCAFQRTGLQTWTFCVHILSFNFTLFLFTNFIFICMFLLARYLVIYFMWHYLFCDSLLCCYHPMISTFESCINPFDHMHPHAPDQYFPNSSACALYKENGCNLSVPVHRIIVKLSSVVIYALE